MATLVGRDVYGNSVQFTADAQTIEADAATVAETAVTKNAGGSVTLSATAPITTSGLITGGTITSTGLATLASATITGVATIGGLASAVGAITAGTTQTLAGATALKMISVLTVANTGDGVKFNVAATGSGRIFIVSAVGATHAPNIWPNAADKIDGGTTGAAVALTVANRIAVFIDTAANNWTSALLGAVSS